MGRCQHRPTTDPDQARRAPIDDEGVMSRRALWSLLSVLLCSLTSSLVLAKILLTSGYAVKISPPASVKAGALANDTKIYAFDELQSVTLVNAVPIQANAPGLFDQNSDLVSASVAAGLIVNSHYLHYDPKGLTNNPAITGTVTFSTPVLGIIENDGNLTDTNIFGATNTLYPGLFSDKGYELGAGDWFRISSNMRSLSVRVQAVGGVDDLRIITAGLPASGATCSLDVVFVIDTSGSMDDEAVNLCTRISSMVGQLYSTGYDVNVEVLGISEANQRCLTSSVLTKFGAAVPGTSSCGTNLIGCAGPEDDKENWGAATAIVAARYPWRSGAERMIVPISDEGPCCGCQSNPCTCDTDDSSAVSNMIAQGLQNKVHISPLLGTGVSACVVTLADQVAQATSGSVFNATSSADDLVASVTSMVHGACTTPVPPPVPPPGVPLSQQTGVILLGLGILASGALLLASRKRNIPID